MTKNERILALVKSQKQGAEDQINDILETMTEEERVDTLALIMSEAEEHKKTVDELRANKKIARKQLMSAAKGKDVTCFCEKVTVPAFKLYRCYYCGIFFCDRCAPDHFGQTREEHNEENYKEFMVPRR